MEGIIHFLTGYVVLEIQGESNRFLNMIAKSGIAIWGFQKQKDCSLICMRARDYRRLLEIRHRCKVSIICHEKHGLPFHTKKLMRRKGALIGAGVFIALYVLLSGFIWEVQVTGQVLLTKTEILSAAKQAGIETGIRKQDINSPQMAQKLMLSLKDLSWVSVNTDGCTVQISIKEANKVPEPPETGIPSNIVAKREGKVLFMEAQSGMPQVKIGDVVEKGQLLIAGIYTEKIDPYREMKRTPKMTIGSARGKVTAETYREFKVTVSREDERELFTGEMKVNKNLLFFGLKIPLGLNTVPKSLYKKYESENRLELLDKEMPVGLVEDHYLILAKKTGETLSEEATKDKALLKLRELQESVVGEGGKVIEEEIQFNITETNCEIMATSRCEEQIGEVLEVEIE